MTTNQIKDIIEQIADLGIVSLSFTGGEPTLRKDLPELIRYAGIKKDLITGLATNGSYLPTLLRKKTLQGLDYILLSLDFPYADQHNKMRGIPLFDKVLESIRLANQKDVNIILSTNVMKTNLNLLPEICQLADKFNCSIELFPCENIIRYYNGKKFQAKNVDTLIPNLHLWAKIIRGLQKEFKNVITDQFSIQVIERGGFGGIPKLQNIMRCHVAEAYLFIRHDGTISFPCKIHPLLSFNALEKPLRTLFNLKEVRKIMNKNDDFEFCDGCRLGCAVSSSLTARWPTIYEKYIRNILRGNL
jgi:MoaA/NifB/PqqE/SkfB family radical SAM enzyme